MVKTSFLLVLSISLLTVCNSSIQSENAGTTHNNASSSHIPSGDDRIIDSDLERNRKLWESMNITNYRMELKLETSGYTPFAQPVSIDVENDLPSIPVPLNSRDKRKLWGYESYNTVSKQFDYINKTIGEHRDVKVEYDRGFGFPTHIEIKTVPPSGWEDFHVVKLERK